MAQNKQIRKKRPQLRKLCRSARDAHSEDPKKNPFNPRDDHVELLCKMMNIQQFNRLIKDIPTSSGPHTYREMVIRFVLNLFFEFLFILLIF